MHTNLETTDCKFRSPSLKARVRRVHRQGYVSIGRVLVWIALLWWPVGCDRTVEQLPLKENQPENVTSQADSAGAAGTANPTQAAMDLTEPELGPRPLAQPAAAPQLDPAESSVVSGQTGAAEQQSSSPPTDASGTRVVEVEIKRLSDPIKMIEYLADIDRSLDILLLSNSQKDPESFKQNAIQLSRMKLAAAQHLAGLPGISAEQQKLATKTQLIALSHLSGLKDVPSAKQLEQLAGELSNSQDPDLRQQGRIVQLGFAVQNLQNGLISDPNSIVLASRELIAEENFRGRLEMTSLQHVMNVLEQMGYDDQLSQLQRVVFDAFASSQDQPLRREAWNRLTSSSDSLQQLLTAIASLQDQSLGTSAVNSESTLVNSAKKLLQEFPNPVTLEMLASMIPDVEYSGQVQASAQLADQIRSEREVFPKGPSIEVVDNILQEQKLRTGWLGKPLEMLDVVDLDGQPLNLAGYAGKVVLVDFWASWCLPCLKELPVLEKTYAELQADGFEILSVNMDMDLAAMKQFVKDRPMPWKVYRSANGDTRPLTQHFGITMFPHLMLVDRSGKIARLHVRGENLQAAVREFLKN